MYHFFVEPEQIQDKEIIITGSDVNHIKNVLRMKTGEELEISDGNNKKYLCKIEKISQDMVCVVVKGEHKADTELPSRIYLFQGLPKSDKMELIIQKAVEVQQDDTPEILQRRVMEQAEWKLLPQAVAMLCEQLEQEKRADQYNLCF